MKKLILALSVLTLLAATPVTVSDAFAKKPSRAALVKVERKTIRASYKAANRSMRRYNYVRHDKYTLRAERRTARAYQRMLKKNPQAAAYIYY